MIQKTQKMLKKAHIQQKLSCNILKNMLDMDVMFFGGRNTFHGLTLKRLPNPQPTERQKQKSQTSCNHLDSSLEKLEKRRNDLDLSQLQNYKIYL